MQSSSPIALCLPMALILIIQSCNCQLMDSKHIACREPNGTIINPSRHISEYRNMDSLVRSCLVCRCQNRFISCEYTSSECKERPPTIENIKLRSMGQEMLTVASKRIRTSTSAPTTTTTTTPATSTTSADKLTTSAPMKKTTVIDIHARVYPTGPSVDTGEPKTSFLKRMRDWAVIRGQDPDEVEKFFTADEEELEEPQVEGEQSDLIQLDEEESASELPPKIPTTDDSTFEQNDNPTTFETTTQTPEPTTTTIEPTTTTTGKPSTTTPTTTTTFKPSTTTTTTTLAGTRIISGSRVTFQTANLPRFSFKESVDKATREPQLPIWHNAIEEPQVLSALEKYQKSSSSYIIEMLLFGLVFVLVCTTFLVVLPYMIHLQRQIKKNKLPEQPNRQYPHIPVPTTFMSYGEDFYI